MKWSPLALLAALGCAPGQEKEPSGTQVEPGAVRTWDEWDDALERAAAGAPAEAGAVRLITRDGRGELVPVLDLLPPAPPSPTEQEVGIRREMPVDHPGAQAGGLSGKAVYLSQCHGWMWRENLARFDLQRGNVFDTVEDYHNPEGANQYLTAYLENAGARVFTTRERDLTVDTVIVDDADPFDGTRGYAEVGGGFQAGQLGFGRRATYPYGVDPFDAGGTRRFPAAGGGVARWTPAVPADGWYAVYVSWDAASDHAPDAHYRIAHPGGTLDRWYDQTRHGSTWQYVETLWLPAGSGGLVVELVGDSADPADWLSADAVRLGGGLGDVSRYGETTGQPRWEEGAVLYTQYNGAPTSVYDPYGDGDGSDPSSRSRWADWEHPSGEDAVYLSWHSNATADGSARGTVTYFAGGGPDAPPDRPPECSQGAVEGSYTLSALVQAELMDVIHTVWDPAWFDRGIKAACFSEVSPSHNDEMPSTLVELAFHDNADDVLYLKHPEFRRDASRAMYRAITRYFAERDGLQPAYLPEPPEAVVFENRAGGLRLSWDPGRIGAPWGDAPTGYLVQTSPDGRAWDAGFAVAGTAVTVPAAEGEVVFARVAAVNDGGVSFPSEVVGARRGQGDADVLVVAAFDRNDRGLLFEHFAHPTVGVVDRMDLRRMNAFDLVAAHGRAIGGAGFAFDSATDEAGVALADYRAVVWATGEESTDDETFSTAQQTEVSAFVSGGGGLWTSGAEILWDLDRMGNAGDRAFAAGVLGAGLQADAASTDAVQGEGVLAGVGPLDFGDSPYPVEWPDVLASGREVLATYGGDPGQVAAVWDRRVALFGFPFDAIRDERVQVEVAARVLTELAAALELVHGPLLAGQSATFEASGADPGETVTFGWGTAIGLGPCPPVLAGRCLGIAQPAILGTAVADGSGVATLVRRLPGQAAGVDLAVQAVAVRGGVGPALSNVTLDTVQ